MGASLTSLDQRILELCAAALANPERERLNEILRELWALLGESIRQVDDLVTDVNIHQSGLPADNPRNAAGRV